jgi:hypothetical protein
MFTYAHLRGDLLPVSQGVTDSDGNAEFSRSSVGAGLFVDEYQVTLNEFSSTYRVSYSTGTYPRSATSYEVTDFESTASTDGGNGGQTVGSAVFGLSSTGVDSHTFTAPATQTHSFTTQWFSNAGTTLSGSASATRTTTGSRTLTMTGVTTLVPAAVPASFVEKRRFVARELPFGSLPEGLRRVALAYGASEITATGSLTVGSLQTGEQTYNSTRLVSTSTSSTDTAATSYSTKYIRQTAHASSAMGAGRVTAARKRFSGTVFYDLSGSSGSAMAQTGSDQAINPTVAPTFVEFVSIAPDNVLSRRVFTQPESMTQGSAYSIGGSSAILNWSYLSSSWQLLATLKNSDTSTTTQISLLTSAAASTTTEAATTALGLSTCVLGPRLPFATSGLPDVSVSLSASLNTSRTFVIQQGAGTTGSAVSSSSAYAVSSSSSFSNGTANSNLSFFASAPAVSISTSSVNDFEIFGQSDVTIYRNSKWNEAGTSDTISVVQ